MPLLRIVVDKFIKFPKVVGDSVEVETSVVIESKLEVKMERIVGNWVVVV